MVYSWYEKWRILYYYQQGYLPPTITKLQKDKGTVTTSRIGIAKFIKKFITTGSIARSPGSGRPLKITRKIQRIVDEWMMEDDETTAIQLHALFL